MADLRESDAERQLRLIADNVRVGLARCDTEGRYTFVNRHWAERRCVTAGQIVGKRVREVVGEEHWATFEHHFRECLAGNAVEFESEVDFPYRPGDPQFVHCCYEPEWRDGKVVGLIAAITNITALKRGEASLREKAYLLLREINHRAKNMLSLVQAIARQTAAREPEDFIDRFTERIQALAANLDLLVRNEWQGFDVEDLVRAELAHFADLVGARIAMHGPSLRLNAAAAQTIGLTLHELATNAGKYGALSTDVGCVDACWGTDGNTFTMSWSERDGPRVSAPKRRGFGTTVMKEMAEHSLGGTVDLDYAPSGLTWRLTCPAKDSLESRESSSIVRERATKRVSMACRHVAIGEKNIARQREIVAWLERGGHNSQMAKSLLASFEELQNMHIAHRDRLEKALSELSK